MRRIKVAAVALNQTPLDWRANVDHIRGALGHARDAGVDVVCLPELCISGYGVEDFFLSEGVLERAWRHLIALLPETQGVMTCLGLPVAHRGKRYNAVAVACDGALIALVCKRFLAGDGLHYEPRWFDPWPVGQVETYAADGLEVPIGDCYVDCGGVRVGVEICRDAWVDGRPAAALEAFGVDIIMNPSATHFAFGKLAIREAICEQASRDYGVTYLHANLLGNESGRAIYDGGSLIAAEGEIIARGGRFGYLDGEVTMATVALHANAAERALAPDHRCVHAPFTWTESDPLDTPLRPSADWERSPFLKEEAFTRATALALFDYLRKSGAQGFVVSLSGGADSAACACLVSVMVDLAVEDLGLEGFKARLGHIEALQGVNDEREAMGVLLTTVYQSTSNSGAVTRAAAHQLAEAIGAEHLELDVDEVVSGYVERIEAVIGRALSWERDDVALQNIQARSRGPGVWMLANIKGALLLATSNRSEAAVGYATMDGDTCGGLSPIAGIDKAFLLAWLAWLAEEGPQGLAPIEALDAVCAQEPTAELRPAEMGQTDEGDLMPYPLLNAIEKAAIRDRRTPSEVYLDLRGEFDALTPAALGAHVERFFTLWARNQWKRERYAPSFHVDDESLDPKTWCRFPILNGGFAEELLALRQLIEGER